MKPLLAVILFLQACTLGTASGGRQIPVWPDVPDHDHPPTAVSADQPAVEDDTEADSDDDSGNAHHIPSPPGSLSTVNNDVSATLADESFAFCHDESYPLLTHEREFCPLLKAENQRCPAFSAACAAAEKEKPSSCHVDEPERPQAELKAVGGVLKGLYYLVIVLGIGLVLWLVLRYAIPDAVEEGDTAATPPPEGESPSHEERIAVETDVSRLLARARAHAGSGAFRKAIHDLHAALIRRLEGYRLIRVHPSRTNGDFLRDLAGRDELRGEVRDMLADVDRMEFGTGVPDAAAYESLLSKVSAFVARPLALLLVFIAASGLIACGLLKRGDVTTVPSGHGALVKFLERSGYEASFRVESLEHWQGEGIGQFLLLSDAPHMPESTIQSLFEFMHDGGTLIVAGTVRAPAPLLEAAGIHSIEPDEARTVAFPEGALPKERANPPVARLPRGHVLRLDEAKAKKLGVRTYLGSGEKPYAVIRRYGDDGRLLVFADDRLFSNVALAVGDNAAVVLHVFAEHGPHVQVLSRLTGSISTNPAQTLSKAGLTAFLFHLLAWVALFILWKGIPFGTPRDPEHTHRRAFAEHVRALGLLYARAKASRWVLAAYGSYVFDRLRDRLRLHGQQGFARMTQALAIRSGRDQGEIGRLLAETMDAKENPKLESHSPEAIKTNLAIMRELSELLGTPEKPPARKRKDKTP